jgi:hypothetical protein
MQSGIMPSDALTRRFSREVISSTCCAWMVRRERQPLSAAPTEIWL